MKKIALLLTLLLTICSSAFAWHEPDRQELTEIQRKLCGLFLDRNNISFSLRIDDNGVVFVGNSKKLCIVHPAKVEVDYNGFCIRVTGEGMYKEKVDVYIKESNMYKNDRYYYDYKCVIVTDNCGLFKSGVYLGK